MSLLPGQAGSPVPAGPDYLVRQNRQLTQTNEQLKGQVAQLRAALNGAVVNVTVSGSTLTVTHGDGTSTSYSLP